MIAILIILVLCSVLIIFYTIRLLLKMKKQELGREINSFCVYIKFPNAMIAGFLGIITSILPVWLPFFIFEEILSILIMAAGFYFIAIYILALIQIGLTVKDKQIVYIGFFGNKKIFTFEDVEKVEIYADRAGDHLRLVDYNNKVICNVSFKYNNIDLLIERLKDASVIGINKIAEETSTHEEPQNFKNDKIIVKNKSGTFAIYCMFILIFGVPVMFLSVLDCIYAYNIMRAYAGLTVAILFNILFIFLMLHTLFFRLTINNGTFEYRNFIGYRREFKIEDISHVKLLPNANIFNSAHIFLKNGKCVCKVDKSYKNFDLLIKTFKRAGIGLI